MAVESELLQDIKDELFITWNDDTTNRRITKYIENGKVHIQKSIGKALNFTEPGDARTLLFAYCRYANSQALEVFDANYKNMLVGMNFENRVDEYAETLDADGHHAHHSHGGCHDGD